MTRKLFVVCMTLLASVAAVGGVALATPAPASAETRPTATMVVVKNVAGDRSHGYRCVIASTGGIDCDWTTPVRVPVPRHG